MGALSFLILVVVLAWEVLMTSRSEKIVKSQREDRNRTNGGHDR